MDAFARRKIGSLRWFLGATLFSSLTGAQGVVPVQPIPPLKPPNEARHYSIAVEFNPLSLLISRVSVSLEALVASHHAIILTGGVIPNSQPAFSGDSAELGYRFYSNPVKLAGIFAGLSGYYTRYEYDTDQLTSQIPPHVRVNIAGVAADVGYQWIIDPGFVIGTGGGLQWQHSDRVYAPMYSDYPFPNLITQSGPFPRFLLSVGAAF